MLIFKGNDRFAYRDPACYYFGGAYRLFFTVSEKEDGYMYNRIGYSQSKDLLNWSEPVIITEKNLNLNFCSPGNIIRRGDEYIMCFTSYPMPFRYEVRDHAGESARLFTMTTTDFESFSEPEMLLVKGDTKAEELGRMIDPYIMEKDGEYYIFYKQNGVSLSRSRDLKSWEYLGHTEGGENACVVEHEGEYLLIHSPHNGIGFKKSKDLLNWSEYGHTILLQPDWEWARNRLTAGFAMRAENGFAYKYILFFHGSENGDPETHGNASLAVAFTNDFKKFYYEL